MITRFADYGLTVWEAALIAGYQQCASCRHWLPKGMMCDARCLKCTVAEDYPLGMESTR